MAVVSSVRCRLFEPGDLPALFAIEEVCFPPSIRFSRELMRSLTADPLCRTWMGMAGETRVGFAIVGLRGDEELETAYIWTIEVLPGFRRRGIARSLLERAEASARAGNCTAIGLHVDARNLSAMALYERAGFVHIGVDVEFYGRGQNAFQYRRDLNIT